MEDRGEFLVPVNDLNRFAHTTLVDDRIVRAN